MSTNLEQKPQTEVKRPYPLPPLPPNRIYVEDTMAAGQYPGSLMLTEDSDPFDSYGYRLEKVLFSGRTKYQDVLIADSYNFGRVLVLDGAIQSSEDDENLYHELLVQPAMLRHPDPKDVLIIGGGEGASLREVLVHSSVKSATMVDLDGEVVEMCREHLPSWHRGAFDDPRAKLVIADGRKFVEEDDSKYDVIVIDVVDMLDNGPAQALYTKEFYAMLKRRLREGGIVVVQGMEFSFLDDRGHAALFRTLRTVFSEVHSYSSLIPSFLSSWGFLIASDWFVPQEWKAEAIDKAIKTKLGSNYLSHLTGEFLLSRFALCKETAFLLSLPGPVLEDGVEFVPPPFIDDIEPDLMSFPVDPSQG